MTNKSEEQFLEEEKTLIINEGYNLTEFKQHNLPTLRNYTTLPPPRNPIKLILPIAALHATQAYVHQPTAQQYKHILEQHQKLKPIRITIALNHKIIITNGTHRVQAALEYGKNTIEAIWY